MSVSSRASEAHLHAAIQLAKRGLGLTWPNPSVGCVITDPESYVIGRGHTQPGGRPHAEIMALQMAGGAARGGTAYVSLEPCCHTGKSGPCTEALIKAGIKRAIIAAADPDPRVNGGGIIALRAAGMEVEFHEMAEAQEIVAGFVQRVKNGRPLFFCKIAASLDGRIALDNGKSKWITGENSRRLVHLWRAQSDAILSSIGTVEADDPEFTCRLPGCPSPIRIIVDRELRLSPQSRLMQTLDQSPLWLIISDQVPYAQELLFLDKVSQYRTIKGLEILRCPINKAGKLNLLAMADLLGSRGLTRIMIEAGAKFATAMMKENLVQRLLWFQADTLLGGDSKASVDALGLVDMAAVIKLTLIEEGRAGKDRWFYYRLGR